MDLAELMLSSTGRIARVPFVLASAALLAVAVAYRLLAGPTLHRLTAWLVYGALLFCAACLTSKRLHDRGRAGWWAGLVLAAVIALWPLQGGPAAVFWSAVLALAVIDLVLAPGRRGNNRFG